MLLSKKKLLIVLLPLMLICHSAFADDVKTITDGDASAKAETNFLDAPSEQTGPGTSVSLIEEKKADEQKKPEVKKAEVQKSEKLRVEDAIKNTIAPLESYYELASRMNDEVNGVISNVENNYKDIRTNIQQRSYRTAELSGGEPTNAAYSNRQAEIQATYDQEEKEKKEYYNTYTQTLAPILNPMYEEYRNNVKNSPTIPSLTLVDNELEIEEIKYDGDKFMFHIYFKDKTAEDKKIQNRFYAIINYKFIAQKSPVPNYNSPGYDEYNDLVDYYTSPEFLRVVNSSKNPALLNLELKYNVVYNTKAPFCIVVPIVNVYREGEVAHADLRINTGLDYDPGYTSIAFEYKLDKYNASIPLKADLSFPIGKVPYYDSVAEGLKAANYVRNNHLKGTKIVSGSLEEAEVKEGENVSTLKKLHDDFFRTPSVYKGPTRSYFKMLFSIHYDYYLNTESATVSGIKMKDNKNLRFHTMDTSIGFMFFPADFFGFGFKLGVTTVIRTREYDVDREKQNPFSVTAMIRFNLKHNVMLEGAYSYNPFVGHGFFFLPGVVLPLDKNSGVATEVAFKLGYNLTTGVTVGAYTGVSYDF